MMTTAFADDMRGIDSMAHVIEESSVFEVMKSECLQNHDDIKVKENKRKSNDHICDQNMQLPRNFAVYVVYDFRGQEFHKDDKEPDVHVTLEHACTFPCFPGTDESRT